MTDSEHDDDGTDDGEPEVGTATDLLYVGPVTASALDEAGIDPAGLLRKDVSHAQLRAAGVNPGVAAKIRREYSLAWTFDGGEDLDRRAEQVRGLGDDERAWVAASSGDWQAGQAASERATVVEAPDAETEAEADGSGSAAEAESAWQERSKPTPVTEIAGVGEKRAELLATAGINSVRSLALADPEEVADSLDLGVDRVRGWRDDARELL